MENKERLAYECYYNGHKYKKFDDQWDKCIICDNVRNRNKDDGKDTK